MQAKEFWVCLFVAFAFALCMKNSCKSEEASKAKQRRIEKSSKIQEAKNWREEKWKKKHFAILWVFAFQFEFDFCVHLSILAFADTFAFLQSIKLRIADSEKLCFCCWVCLPQTKSGEIRTTFKSRFASKIELFCLLEELSKAARFAYWFRRNFRFCAANR